MPTNLTFDLPACLHIHARCWQGPLCSRGAESAEEGDALTSRYKVRLLSKLPGIIVHTISSVVVLVSIAASSSSILWVKGKWVYVLFYALAHLLGEPAVVLRLKTVHIYTYSLRNAEQVSLTALYVTHG